MSKAVAPNLANRFVLAVFRTAHTGCVAGSGTKVLEKQQRLLLAAARKLSPISFAHCWRRSRCRFDAQDIKKIDQ
jgi:hypothetical protein